MPCLDTMAKQAERSDRVCLTHPDRPAGARCAQCGKPVCTECAVSHDSRTFCSDGCVTARAEYESREARRKLAGTRTERFSVQEWAWRGLVLLLAAGILYYVFGMQHVRSLGDFGDMLRRMFW